MNWHFALMCAAVVGAAIPLGWRPASYALAATWVAVETLARAGISHDALVCAIAIGDGICLAALVYFYRCWLDAAIIALILIYRAFALVLPNTTQAWWLLWSIMLLEMVFAWPWPSLARSRGANCANLSGPWRV